MGFAAIEEALEAIRRGGLVIVVDDPGRENEGDFICAAELCTPQIVNFMAKEGRGLICVALPQERADALGLEPMVRENSSLMGTPFTVSVDARERTTTGISAADRAETIRRLADPSSRPEDFARPGHVFPLRAKPGGVLARSGHTEAAVDLARLAGLQPVGVLCEIMKEDGTMARVPDLLVMARRWNIPICTIADLIEYRRRREKLITRIAMASLPTRYGDFTVHVYRSLIDGLAHVAMVAGEVSGEEPVLVRVHSECLTGDALGSLRCDCGQQLDRALSLIGGEGRGVLLYMRQEGRGIGLENKIRAYELQDRGLDTVEANHALGFPPDLRDYGIGAQILVDLGVRRLRLLTNNPRKIVGLAGYGLEVVERVPLVVPAGEHNKRYLEAKRRKLGHLIEEGGGGER